MSATHLRRTVATVGVAGSGLVLGHWLAYALGEPQAHARDELLRATGHGYLPYATQVAVLAAALGLAALFLIRLAGRGGRGSFPRDAAVLASVQCGAFLAMEAGERLLAGASLHDLTHGPLLAIGLGMQLAVALTAAAIVRLTERAADAADALRRPTALTVPALVHAVPSPVTHFPRRPSVRSVASRAPPSLP
jgi:hypothetical protein